MTAPTVTLSVTDRHILKGMTLEKSMAVQAGRLMWCHGRKILGYGNVLDLPRVMLIPKGTDTVCLSAADYDDVKGWLG